jgi:hypothetical protein
MKVELVTLFKFGASLGQFASYGFHDVQVCKDLVGQIAVRAQQSLSLDASRIPEGLKSATVWIGCLKTVIDNGSSQGKAPRGDPDRLDWDHVKRLELYLKADVGQPLRRI